MNAARKAVAATPPSQKSGGGASRLRRRSKGRAAAFGTAEEDARAFVAMAEDHALEKHFPARDRMGE